MAVCLYCGRVEDSLVAVTEGWVPVFYTGPYRDKTALIIHRPMCNCCSKILLYLEEDTMEFVRRNPLLN